MVHRFAVLILAVPLGNPEIHDSPSFAQDRVLMNERPHIIVDANGLGEIYARCSGAGTRIYRVGEDKDQLIGRYEWYCSRFPNKLYLISTGYTKGRPDIAIYRPRNVRSAGQDPKKQVEFDLYFNGKHVRQFTSQQLVDLGAALKQSSDEEIGRSYPAGAIYADFTFQGYDGYHALERGGVGYCSLKMSNGRIVLIEFSTGKVIKDPYANSGRVTRPKP